MRIKMFGKLNKILEQNQKIISEINEILAEMELNTIAINNDIDKFLEKYKNTQNLVIASNKTANN